MDTAKPAPIMVGDKPLYTLSSYDPVEVEVVVPFTSESEVDLALTSMVLDEGGTPESLKDAAWVAQHFDGLRSADELRRVVRARLREMNAGFAESQKRDKCLAGLAERLEQAVPDDRLAAMRESIADNFRRRAAANGITMDDFIARGGVSKAEFEAMLDTQALQTAQIDAALDAYAHKKGIKAAENEFDRLLGMDPKNVKELVKQARAAGRYDDVADTATRAKAAEDAVAECACTYHHESEQEAAVRLKMLQDLMAQG